MQDRFKSNTSLLLFFLKGSIKYFVLSIIFAMIASIFELINPKIIGFTIDSVIGNKQANLPLFITNIINNHGGIELLKNNLWILALIILFVSLLRALFRLLFRIYNALGAETLVKRIRDELFSHILKLPFKWHSENHTGEIMQRCTSDVEQIKMFLSEQLSTLFRVFVLIGLAIYFMYITNVKLTLVSIAFIPIIMGYSFFFHKKIGNRFEKADEEEAKLSQIAQENLTGVRVVRAFGKEIYERKRFEKQNQSYTDMWIKLLRVLSTFWSTSDIFSHGQIIAIITYGVILCVNNELSAGDYIAFVSYNALLTWPIRMLGRVIADMSKAGISLDRLKYIMNAEEEKDDANDIEVDIFDDIHFKNVSYKYDNGSTEILHNINLDIKKGTTVGILGGTGSGKSTLMYLLDKLYELKDGEGEIYIGKTNINDIKTSYLRDNIGMVLQEPYLFSRSLADNIKIAKQSANIDDIKRVSSIAALDDTINKFKEGYEVFVGERGVTLSGGQKQRTVIAQMLLRQAPIMIFDDSLSAVDSRTDAKIRNSLRNNVGESTVIIIAHRISTLMHADKIVVMEDGRIIEEGKHQELIDLNGTYKKIYDLQINQGLLEGGNE